ncbi:ISL3 family transposase [Planobispora takensis]|uniref:ISL3 family transposase n=3 Tax=Planobispora takensis TaxID=1367882 RepID=A0A8J3T779_9ACTN|nr:ISL3 family transposase [Planobispora takensis]GII06185.1 ISL3 family transposase [Planobispora takensis]
MLIKELVAILFPHLARVCVDQVFRSGATVRIRARTDTMEAACPDCGIQSRRRHSHYERQLSDIAVGGQELLIHLRVHRFFCRNVVCARTTFAEQIPDLTVRYGRRSIPAAQALQAIALALGGRAGARLTQHLATSVSRMTLIRLIRSLPEPPLPAGPRVLGVDDFAYRRGHSYGTILIDISTSTVVDVLTDRTADTLAAWLQAHPGVEIVCRDRAGAYAEGAARGAPDAIQVADRWHLWRNLGEAVERTLTRHRHHLPSLTSMLSTQPSPSLPLQAPTAPRSPADREDRIAIRTRERHAVVHALLKQGHGVREIARRLNLGRNTIRRFTRAGSPEDLLVHTGTGQRPKALDAYDGYLRKRWTEGCTNAELLCGELRDLGYRGSSTAVRQYIRPWRAGLPPTPTSPRPPTVRQATGWFLRNPTHLDAGEQRQLDTLTAVCPQLAALRVHVRQFAEMMMNRRGRNLEAWINAVLRDDLPELHSFVTGLRRDQDAVTAGLSLPYSSGPVEGHVNRTKMIKRQMYGRANPDLLRKRILLAD